MNKTTFSDGTTPGITASFLNNFQDEFISLQNKVKSAIQVKLNAGSNITTNSNQNAKIPFDTTVNTKGTGLTLSSNGVKIGAEISKVKVTLSGNIGNSSSSSATVGLIIAKNDYTLTYQTIKVANGSNSYVDLGTAVAIIDVTKNDVIYGYIRSVGATNKTFSLNSSLNTSMIVEEM